MIRQDLTSIIKNAKVGICYRFKIMNRLTKLSYFYVGFRRSIYSDHIALKTLDCNSISDFKSITKDLHGISNYTDYLRINRQNQVVFGSVLQQHFILNDNNSVIIDNNSDIGITII